MPPRDCRTFDWRQPPVPASPQPSALSVEEGSIGCLQNQVRTEFEAKVGAHFESTFTMPPLEPRRDPSDVVQVPTWVAPLSQYSDWTMDSKDTVWMADYHDFISNHSSDENSDWLLDDERVDPIPDGLGIDLEDYVQYTFVDLNQRATLEHICFKYQDSEWGQALKELALPLERASFRGPFPSSTQCFTRNKQNPRYFFDLWWDDDTITTLVEQTNVYALQ